MNLGGIGDAQCLPWTTINGTTPIRREGKVLNILVIFKFLGYCLLSQKCLRFLKQALLAASLRSVDHVFFTFFI
jgi:hypothetical protein